MNRAGQDALPSAPVSDCPTTMPLPLTPNSLQTLSAPIMCDVPAGILRRRKYESPRIAACRLRNRVAGVGWE